MFVRDIFAETVKAGSCLTVMGTGLGLERLYALLVRLYSSPRVLVLVLGMGKDEADQLVAATLGDSAVERRPSVVRSQPAAERAKLYTAGGVVFVSARVLVLDLLRGVVPYRLLTGVLVHGAHSIAEHGALAFCLRLVRHHGSASAFLKGFTDNVQALRSEARLQAALRALFTGHVLLWPRFEARICRELDPHAPDVVELCPPLTVRMHAVLGALQRLVPAMVQEIEASNPGMEVPTATPDNALLLNWSALISGQLRSEWNRVSAKTRQFVSDLATLRTMSRYVLQYDCIKFNRYLETIRVDGVGGQSSWMFSDAADDLWKHARMRVLDPATKELVLEPQPKWAALQEVLDEIRAANSGGNVLLVCRDNSTAAQVTGVLTLGPKAWLAKQWASTVSLQEPRRQHMRSRSVPEAPPPQQQSSSSSSSRGRGRSRGSAPGARKRSTSTSSRRSSPGRTNASSVVDLLLRGDAINNNDNHINAPAALAAGVSNALPALPPPPSGSASARRDALDRSFGPVAGRDMVVVVHCLDSSIKVSTMLHSLAPLFVVAYDTDLGLLRSLECYRSTAEGRARPLRVYLLAYAEEELHESQDLAAENAAFEEVIRTKATMVVEDERGRVLRGDPRTASAAASTAAPEGRIAQLLLEEDAARRPYVVVDTREFNGALVPSKLWCEGFDVVPLTLEIGDYVLSDEVCVERKTVADLISSFADGRLYKQCTNMQEHYAVPVLLIEFSPDAFYLQLRHEIGPTISHEALSSKLALLVLHFPTLRIFWSRDTAQTLSFVRALRRHTLTGGPDLNRIRQSAVDAVREADDAVDATPQLFLAQLPGVLAGNRDAIMQRAGNLRGLFADWDEASYAPLMGVANAAKLGAFMVHQHRAPEPDVKQ